MLQGIFKLVKLIFNQFPGDGSTVQCSRKDFLLITKARNRVQSTTRKGPAYSSTRLKLNSWAFQSPFSDLSTFPSSCLAKTYGAILDPFLSHSNSDSLGNALGSTLLRFLFSFVSRKCVTNCWNSFMTAELKLP